MDTKNCTACNTEKSITDFGVRKKSKDGLDYKCSGCAKAYQLSHKKTCSACKLIKPFAEFYKRKRNKDGLKYKCKTCTILYQLKYTSPTNTHNLKDQRIRDKRIQDTKDLLKELTTTGGK